MAFQFCVVAMAMAQTTIRGRVVDAEGQPLIGCNVTLGPATGTSTDIDGNYQIDTKQTGDVVLKASYAGYKTETAKVQLSGNLINQDFTLEEDALGLDEVVVTGVANQKSKLESSVSISTMNSQSLSQVVANNTSEIFRSIPGIRSESSGGDGNTNITARGVPISSGGSKYLQLQEDGLPVMLFGDIAFATSDIFLRADQTIDRIEAIRGGSASTQSSNSPAGIINFVSKTGAVSGGGIATSVGLGYKNLRTDFSFGAPISDDLSFHVGGFFRQGDGVRSSGFSGNYGGQVKANLTKRFKSGYARIYYKYLNDRSIAYLPMPMQVTGTNENPTWGSVAGYDALTGTMHSTSLMQTLRVGPDGAPQRANVSDGMHPVSQSVGAEFSFDLGEGWKIENRARMSFNSGRFVSPFPATLGTPGQVLDSTVHSFRYADDGTAFGNGNAGNGLAMRIHMFDTELNNMNNFMNDFKLSKAVELTGAKLNFTAGYFKANQNISMSWLWNTYFTDVNGSGSRLLNAYGSDNRLLSDNGLYAYGVPAWGNCCQRNYDTQYDVQAPYANVGVELDGGLSIDASLRWDFGHVTGAFAGSSQSTRDMNNDGTISYPERSVSGVNMASSTSVDYKYDYASYSLGLNYKLNEKQAVFGRYSRGGSAKADRLLFSGLNYRNSSKLNAKDMIDQAELGYKQKFRNGGLFVTGFYAATQEEGGFEATTQKIIKNNYRAFGIELEGTYKIAGFDIRAGLTWTNAKITDAIDATVVDNTPRRQAAFIFNIMPTYTYKKFMVGLSAIGTTSSYAQDNNKLVMPGYVLLNGFARYNVTSALSIELNGNNILNSIGVTEAEEGSITNNTTNYVRGRSIVGRSGNFVVRYSF